MKSTWSYKNLCSRWDQNISNNSELQNYRLSVCVCVCVLSGSSPGATWGGKVVRTQPLLGRINNYAVQLRYQACSLLAALVSLLSDQLTFYERLKMLLERKPFISQKINSMKISVALEFPQSGTKEIMWWDDGRSFGARNIICILRLMLLLWCNSNKYRRMRWAGQVARMGRWEMRTKLVAKPDGK